MDTKNVLVFLAGAAVAYFVIKQIDKAKMKPVSAPNPKLAACQAQLQDALKTVKTTDIEGYKTSFMNDCLSAPEQTIEGTTGNIPADIPSNAPVDSQLGL